MSKRKVHFDEEALDEDLERIFEGDNAKSAKTEKVPSRFKDKHSLDSDEEDQTDKYDVLNTDDIEGQEDGGVDVEEGIRFTPFNMEEEMEEGHFDKEGTYIFKKDKEIRDNWMDNIDWVKVKEKGKEDEEAADDESSDEGDDDEKVDEISIYKQMVEIMAEGENVTRSLKRLGGGKKMSSADRWKAKKNKVEQSAADQQTEQNNKEKLLKLTELANKLLQSGQFEIYQDTYEKLKYKIKADEDAKAKATVNTEGLDDDDALDMFASDLDKNGAASEKKPQAAEKSEPSSSADEIKWEYKWEKEEDDDIHGPFTSAEMLEWQEAGFFKDGVLVRKVNAKDSQFYSSKRIDFDLYT